MTDPVSDAAAAAALEVPAHHLVAGAAAVQARPRWTLGAQAALIDASPAGRYRDHAEEIARRWSETPSVPGAAVASAMRAAATAVAAARAEHAVSLVWTGPPTDALGLRSTRAVLHTLVANASETLVLVAFATYDVDDLATDLAQAAARGVDVALILETPDDPGGPLNLDPPHPFAALRSCARFYRWPAESREAAFAAAARLHAKCVIADRRSALVTSANLTSAGINDNIELGVLLDAGPLPERLHRHFARLIESEALQLVP
ncbi:MAG: DISARM system phospholipase D-like protein DrmC [Actinomycetota bacterium]|nr:DISARM system phospholipase D-like protein DrmC [Actinomycetota bacterium]